MNRKFYPLLLAPIAVFAFGFGGLTLAPSPASAQPTQTRQVKEAGINFTAILLAVLIIGGSYAIVSMILSSQRQAREQQVRSQRRDYDPTGDSAYGGSMGRNFPYQTNNSNMGGTSGVYGYNTRHDGYGDREVIDRSSGYLYGSSGNTDDVEVGDLTANGAQYGDLYQSGNDSEVADAPTGGSLYGNEAEDAQSGNDSFYGSGSSSDT